MDRDDVIREMRRVASRLDRPVTRQDLTRDAFWAVLHWFGSIAKARSAAGLPQPDRNIKWNKQRVLDEMRRLSRGGMVITRRNLEAAGRHDLVGAIGFHVGTLVRARRLARVPGPTYRPTERERWDEDRVIDEIMKRHRRGEALAMAKAPPRLVRAATYYYGGWRAAIETAGLDYDKIRLQREPYSDEELLERLRTLARKKPSLTAGELAHLPWREALVKHFGSPDEAVKRAGIVGWPLRLRAPALMRDGVIAALRKRRRLGKSTYMRAVMLDDHHLFHSVLVHFPDWRSAIVAAKLKNDSPQKRRWTRASLLAAIRARHRKRESLKRPDVLCVDSALVHSASARFGGWAAALREAGVVVPWSLTRWSPERVLSELRRCARGRDRVTVDEAGNKLVSAAQRYFGTFLAACQAAGLSTEEGDAYHRMRFPKKKRARG